MNQPIYRTSLSAWRRLSEIGAIELEGRDADLAYQLKMQIDPAAPDLDTALHSTPTDLFVQAFFQVIQPFVMMFRDILDFFARAGEREGQLQWRISIRNTIVELREFEEFLKHWTEIRCLIDVPHLAPLVLGYRIIYLGAITSLTFFRAFPQSAEQTLGFPISIFGFLIRIRSLYQVPHQSEPRSTHTWS